MAGTHSGSGTLLLRESGIAFSPSGRHKSFFLFAVNPAAFHTDTTSSNVGLRFPLQAGRTSLTTRGGFRDSSSSKLSTGRIWRRSKEQVRQPFEKHFHTGNNVKNIYRSPFGPSSWDVGCFTSVCLWWDVMKVDCTVIQL